MCQLKRISIFPGTHGTTLVLYKIVFKNIMFVYSIQIKSALKLLISHFTLMKRNEISDRAADLIYYEIKLNLFG